MNQEEWCKKKKQITIADCQRIVTAIIDEDGA